jgi:hypothetical protein
MGGFGLLCGLVVLTLLPPPDHIFARWFPFKFIDFIELNARMFGAAFTVDEFSSHLWWQGIAAGAVFIGSLVWFHKQKLMWFYLLPMLLIFCFFALKYRNVWHQGVLFYWWLFVMWLSFARFTRTYGQTNRMYMVIQALMLVVMITQINWALKTVWYDIQYSYSASRKVANYIKNNKYDQKCIFVSGWKSISILPYFDGNIFYNLNNGSEKRFWNWSSYNNSHTGASKSVMATIRHTKPDLVIFASHYIPNNHKIDLEGYAVAGLFKGFLCWKSGKIEPECYLLFTRLKEVKSKKVKTQASRVAG